MRKYAVIAVLVLAGAMLAVPAMASETCPEGNGWTKVEGLSGLTYTFTPDDGFEVTENCMKVGNHDPVFGSGATVTNDSLFNPPGNNLQDISHASFLVVAVTTTTQPEETTTTTTTTEGETTTTTDPADNENPVHEEPAGGRVEASEPPEDDDDDPVIEDEVFSPPLPVLIPDTSGTPADPVEVLPFTGPADGMIAALTALGLSLLATGGLVLRRARDR